MWRVIDMEGKGLEGGDADDEGWRTWGPTCKEVREEVKRGEPRRTLSEVWYLYGPSGTGKTHTANVMAGDDAYWYSIYDATWWSGYDGEESVVMDGLEPRFGVNPVLELIISGDNKLHLPNGRTKEFKSKKVYITSTYKPSAIFSDEAQLTKFIGAVDNWVFFEPNGQFDGTNFSDVRVRTSDVWM